MDMQCEKCGKAVTLCDGKYIYYQDRLLFTCKECGTKLTDEIECYQRICSVVDSKKIQAEQITNNADAFEEFLSNIEKTLKKVPLAGDMLSDVPVLISLVKSYVTGQYKEIPYNTIIAIVATLLYVISPLDLIPDIIPAVGFSDDAMAVAFCVKMIHADLEKYKSWRDNFVCE